MKQWKRLVAVVLTVCMLVSVMPMTVLAEDTSEPADETPVQTDVPEETEETVPVETIEPADNGSCGENLTWEYQDGVLTISGTGEMAYWDNAITFAPWQHLQNQTQEIVICDGVTTISDYAFYGFEMARKVTLPASVYSIGAFAFAGCYALLTVVVDGTYDQFVNVSIYEGNDWFFGADFDFLQDPNRIVEFRIDSVTVPENQYGCWTHLEADEETGDSGAKFFEYSISQLLDMTTYTIRYQNGDEVTGSGNYYYQYGIEFPFTWENEQSYENQWTAGNSYVVEVRAMGKTTQFSVTIDHSPVESMVFAPITITEGECITWNDHYDESTGEKTQYFDYLGWSLLARTSYTIKMRNGDEISGSGSNVYYNGQHYDFMYETNQSFDNRWEAGNTYFLTVDLMGKHVQVPVTIEKSNVAGIQVEPIEIIEKSCGEMTYYYIYDEETGTETEVSYYWYRDNRLLDNVNSTIILENGDTIPVDGNSFEMDGRGYEYSIRTNQGREEQWTLGNTYTIQVFFQGAIAQVPVTIIPSPLESLEFTPVTIIKEENGYQNTEWTDEGEKYYFYYDPWSLISQSTYTVTFTDAPAAEGSGSSFYYKDNRYSFEISTDQSYYNQWTVGNTYYITVSIMGKTAMIPVTIEENPLVSIEFQGLEIPEKTNGSMYPAYGEWGEYLGEYFYYETTSLLRKTSYVATFRDGTVLTNTSPGCAEGHFTYNGKIYEFIHSTNQGYDNQWVVDGNYSIEVSVMGQTVQIPVTITPTPLASIYVPAITVQEGVQGYWTSDYDEFTGTYLEYYCYDVFSAISNAGYTLSFRDGMQFTIYGNYFTYNGEEYYLDIQYEQNYYNQWTAGNTYTVQVSAMNQTAEVLITVNPSPLVSLEFTPITLIEHDQSCGYWNSFFDPMTGMSYNYFYYYEGNLLSKTNFVATFVGGHQIQGNAGAGGFFYDGIWHSFTVNTYQSYANQWQANNTYEATVTVFGKRVQIPVSITRSSYADGFTYVIQNNQAVITNCDACELVLEIPETLDGCPVVGITGLGVAMDYAEEIYIPDSVTMLSTYVFTPYNSMVSPLRKIVFGSGVSGLDDYMLGYATALEEIVVSADNAEYCTIDGVLYNAECTELIAYPSAKQSLHQIPDSVEYIDALINALMTSSSIRVSFGAGVRDYVMENGVIYNADKTMLIASTADTAGVYEMPETVTSIWDSALAYSNFTKITISSGVTEIAYGAFAFSDQLEEVTMPNSVASIGVFAFKECEKLESVNIPASVGYVGYDAYSGCNGLTAVNITDLEAWCNIYFESNMANPLGAGRNLYLNGEKITNLVIPETVTDIGYYTFTFANLESVTLHEGIQSIGTDAFSFSTLPAVELPQSVSYIGNRAFYGCAQLGSVTLNHTITEIPYCAFAMTGLQSVVIPANVRYIGNNAFAGAQLLHVDIQGEGVYIASGAFQNNHIRQIDLDGISDIVGSQAFMDNMFVELTVPDSVTIIAYQSFAYNTNLVNITIPDSVQYIEPCAFEGNAGLQHVLYTGTQEQWNQMENYSLYPATVHFGANGDEVTYTENCTTITYYCSICDKYETINKGVKEHNMLDGVCQDCGQVGDWEYVVNEEAGTVSITGYCGNSQDLYIPETINGLPVTEIMTNAFFGNRKITGVYIPDSVTAIGEYAFSDCTALTDLKLGSGLTTIAPYAFAYNYELHYLTIPEGVATIAYGAFACSNLWDLTIPESVKTIEASAFQSCWELNNVYYKGSPDMWYLVEIGLGNEPLEWAYNFKCLKECGHRVIENGLCMTCITEVSVTVANEDGSRAIYESFAQAVENAASGQTVEIHEDMVEEEIVLASGAELDLNGHTLTADSLTAVGGHIVDNSADGSGLLRISKDEELTISPNNSQVPVYDAEAEGYRLFAICVQPCAITGKNSATPKYWFRIGSNHFGNLNELIQEDAEIQIKVELTWDGQDAVTEAIASAEFTKQWANRCNENSDVYVVFTVTGAEDVENFTLIPSVTANGVTVTGEDMN